MRRRDIIILRKIISEINIGELIKNITDETRQENKQVPWKAVAGMRDIAAHKYQTLRMEDVYYTVQRDFPDLRKLLKEILENIDTCENE